MMTLRIAINDQTIKRVDITNVGLPERFARDDVEGRTAWRAYEIVADGVLSGYVTHNRYDGATKLAALVLAHLSAL